MIDNFKPVSRRAGRRTYTKIDSPNTASSEQEGLKEPAFKPPEEAANEEVKNDPPVDPPKKKGKLGLRSWTKIRHPSKKGWVIIALVIVLLGGGGGAYWYKFIKKGPPAPQKLDLTGKKREPPKPITEPSKLTGVQVAPELNKRSVTGIMIENSPDARPQSGLKDAGVVFEAVAEGGITRFLALFQEAQPDYIGPVRSARPYYLDWTLPFDANYVHAGGSPEAIAQISSLGVRDLNHNESAFTRVSNRYAPHNLYTSIPKLDAYAQSKGYASSNFTGFTRKIEEPSKAPTANSIDLNISSFLYAVHYDYVAAENSYRRYLGGQAHTDERSGAHISPKVVVALVMTKGIAGDGTHTVYGTTGSGVMYVFQDGTVTQGTWTKADRRAQFTFTDAAGKVIAFNPGQTWISIVGQAGLVTFKP